MRRLILLMVCSVPLSAQIDRATLTGVVKDQSRSLVPAAKVTLHTKLRDVEAPFRFENLVVPPPVASTAKPVLPWKPSTAKAELPEGLIAEGRLAWSKDVSFDASGKQRQKLSWLTAHFVHARA